MIQPRTVTALLLGGLVLCATLRADMMPATRQDGGGAVLPDCLGSAPVCCFILPDGTAANCLPQHYRGMIVSFLAESLLTANPLGCRGPPHLAREVSPA